MFKKVDVPILGVVENMSEFHCPHCAKTSRVFGEGGGRDLAAKVGVPVLGAIPMDPAVCRGGEEGAPLVLSAAKSPAAEALTAAARRAAAQVSLQNQRRQQAQSAMSSACRRQEEG